MDWVRSKHRIKPAFLARCPNRLIASWYALLGRPVAYRLSFEGGGLMLTGSASSVVMDCMFTGIPFNAIDIIPFGEDEWSRLLDDPPEGTAED